MDYFAHQSPTVGLGTPRERITAAGGFDPATGENIYKCSGLTDAEVAEHTVKAWLASPVHRANLLKPDFNSVGFGVVRAGDKFMVTQNFSRQVIAIEDLEATASGGTIAYTLKGRVREGASEGAVFVGSDLQGMFKAAGDGSFELQGTVPAGSVIKVNQKKSETSFSAALVIPAAAGLRETGGMLSLDR